MRTMRAGLGRSAESNRRLAGDQNRPLRALRLSKRGSDFFRLLSVDAPSIPTGGFETRELIDGIGKIDGARRS